jgi:hypothetical protein
VHGLFADYSASAKADAVVLESVIVGPRGSSNFLEFDIERMS